MWINIQYTIQHTIVIDIDFLKIWLLKRKSKILMINKMQLNIWKKFNER